MEVVAPVFNEDLETDVELFNSISPILCTLSGNGIYVTGHINNRPTPILLDTGATTSVISEDTWKKSGQYHPEKLENVSVTLETANGEQLDVRGKVRINLCLGRQCIPLSVLVIRDISQQAILGCDFFKDNGCQICYDMGTFVFGGEEIPIHHEKSPPVVCRIVTREKIIIPPGTQVMANSELENGYDKNFGSPGIIESVNNHANGVLVARGLVLPTSCGKAPICLANISENTIIVKPGRTIARFRPLHRECGAVNLFEVESCQQQDRMADVSRTACQPTEQKNWKAVIHADYSRLTGIQKEQFDKLLDNNTDLFAATNSDLGRTHVTEHVIDTQAAMPIKQPPRRLPPFKREEVDKQVEELLQHGRIEPCNSPWSSPIVLARKSDGNYRLCIDYRQLNAVTVKDAQPLPRSDDILESLGGAQWFSCLDMAAGYWQVPVRKSDRPKTAFVTHKGQFQWTCMPFGLTNAPGTFQRLMNLVLKGLAWKECLVYLDDIIIWSHSYEEHLDRLQSVFDRLRAANLKLKPTKCFFLQRFVKFLGHVVSPDGIHTDPEKTKAVNDWPQPKNVTELRGFVGLASYYRRFVPEFSKRAEPLLRLTKKNTEFTWGKEQELAFHDLKTCLVNPPVLAYPNFDAEGGQFILDTDASTGQGIGAVLSQCQTDGTERVIAYGSRSLQPPERNYCATRLEMLALVDFIDHFRYYLLGRKFLVRTDHQALQWLLSFKEPQGQVARWLERLQEYEFEIKHRPGKFHNNADALSRRPRRAHGDCPSCDVKAKLNVIGRTRQRENEDGQLAVGWSPQEIAEAQHRDPDVGNVLKRLEKDKSKPSPKELQNMSQMCRAIWAQFELLQVKDGVLYILPRENKKRFAARIVLPEPLIKPALKQVHDGLEGGHLGQYKTVRKMQARFWRPGLTTTCHDYCSACLTCGKCKSRGKTPKAPLQPIASGYPMQRVHIDVIGPLPKSKKGNMYILTVQCSFTKWIEAYPLRNQKAKTCAESIVRNWVMRYGAPDSIHADQGRNFESALFREMCALLQIKKSRTTAYHPSLTCLTFSCPMVRATSAHVDGGSTPSLKNCSKR